MQTLNIGFIFMHKIFISYLWFSSASSADKLDWIYFLVDEFKCNIWENRNLWDFDFNKINAKIKSISLMEVLGKKNIIIRWSELK